MERSEDRPWDAKRSFSVRRARWSCRPLGVDTIQGFPSSCHAVALSLSSPRRLDEHHDRVGGKFGKLLDEVLAAAGPDLRTALGDPLHCGRDHSEALGERHDVAVQRATPRVDQQPIELAADTLDGCPDVLGPRRPHRILPAACDRSVTTVSSSAKSSGGLPQCGHVRGESNAPTPARST